MPAPPDRERLALDEVAATAIPRAGGWIVVAAFLGIVAVGPVLELVAARNGGATVFGGAPAIPAPRQLLTIARERGALAANEALRTGLHALEDRMGRESALSARLRPDAQLALWRGLDYGNTQVIVGRDDHLYFRTAFDYLVGPPFLDPEVLARRRRSGGSALEPDPAPGLERLGADLARRGIRLVLLPVPVKAAVHPEPLVRFGRLREERFDNPSMSDLTERLERAGVAVWDPLPTLRERARAGETLYFPTDTHWNPRGMEIVARGVAAFLRAGDFLPERPPAGLEKRTFAYDFPGDLVGLLGLGDRAAGVARESTELWEITALGGAPIGSTTGDADVLLLGDSYSVVFAFDIDGRACGFGERLAFELDRPVRRLAKVAANDLPGRIQWLRDDPALLDGVKVVIYEVTSRAFTSTDWSPRPLDPPENRKKRRRRP
ncbi:MAG: hypothetical protein AB7G12_10915 [Thermoanaerobaculia bacterium]